MTSQLLGVFLTFFLGDLLGLVTIINPPATLPFFTALTRGMGDREARCAWPAASCSGCSATGCSTAGGIQRKR